MQKLFGEKRFAEAAERGLQALQADPDNLELTLMVGRSFVHIADFEKARPFLEKVIEADREKTWRFGWANFELAVLHYYLGDLDKAGVCALRALESKATRNLTKAAEYFLAMTGLGPMYKDWSLIETPDLRLHFHPAFASAQLPTFLKKEEAAFAVIQAWFHATLPKKIDIFVWRNNDEAGRAGLGPLAFASRDYNVIHTLLGHTPGHELTHLLSFHAMHPRVTTGLVNEGIAVLFDQMPVNRMTVACAAVANAGVSSVSIRDLWREWPRDETLSYPVAGAFIQRLQQQGGDEKLRELLADQSLESARRIYGEILERWVAEFEKDLISLEKAP